MTTRRTRCSLTIAVASLASLAITAGPAAAALTATNARIDDGAASVRVLVAFSGGSLTGLERQVDAPDPRVADGRAIVRVNATGITMSAPPRTGAGVAVRIRQRAGSILVVLDQATGRRGRFKFVSYRAALARNVLVIDLWKATTRPAAAIRDDRCLRLTRRRSGAGFVTGRGLELRPLFEHNVVLSLRAEGRGGSTIALEPLIATGGVLLPDFSGFARPGRWSGRLDHTESTPRRVMLEAWSASAKDGSLDCLVQAPVVLRPPA